jgi:peptidoglycan hydrolase-like protein with peptidoglycan-binding domain
MPQGRRNPAMRVMLLMLMALLTLPACTTHDEEERGRAALEKMKESLPDVEAKALAQKVAPETVTEAQRALKAAHEYLGDVNGKLDAVTVNAIEAFQRAHGLRDDGILNEKTQRALRDVLAKN